jgi:hypothetical protein
MLMAAIGEQADIDAIIPLLDDQAAEVRVAAAESLRPIPAVEAALLAHAGDPAVFPSVVDMLASGTAGASQFALLLGLTPPDAGLRERWRDGLLRLGSRAPPGDLAAVDAALSAVAAEKMSIAEATVLREQVLSTVLALPPDALAVEQRQVLLRTLARLRSDLNQPEGVIAALDRLLTLGGNGNGGSNGSRVLPSPVVESSEMRALRFLAMARLRQFDQAALVEPDPVAWLATMQAVIEADPPLAALLGEQIEQRFGPQLAAEQRAQLDALAARLPRQDPPAGGGGEGDGATGTSQDQSSAGDGGGRSPS